MSKKDKKTGLGKALQNKLQKKKYQNTAGSSAIFYQQSEENEAYKKKMKMQSIIEQNNLDGYLQVAQLSQEDFQANRNIKFSEIREEMKNKKIILLNNQAKAKITYRPEMGKVLQGLQVPRRPNWQKTQSKEELQKLQNEAYLTWRRKLASIEEADDDLTITPYEKNLEVWRQLWRVVERSQVLVQIVDGRNPLFFYSEDLFEYAREVGKEKFLLVINKSDLVSSECRLRWNQYLLEHKIDHCFFTAKEGKYEQSQEPIVKNTSTVLSPHQLVQIFQQYSGENGVEIGLIGYPNVGKSSVINAVLGKKKVGVASMPGKTKHFQTLKLTEQVTLCDCPGLVFPRVHASKAEMVLNGLYPLDNLKEFEECFDIMAFRVPKEKIEQQYAIYWKEKEPYDGESILVKYATLKGYFGGNGLPIQAQAARHILKDYVNGVLVYNHPPPSSNEDKAYDDHQQQLQQQKANFEKEEGQLENHIDEEFFAKEDEVGQGVQEMLETLTEEDFLDIIEGRKLEGLKVTKQMRKQIKFAMKRGAKCDQLRKILLMKPSSGHKVMIKS